MKFRQHFNYDVEAASDESAVFPEGESLTVQAMAEDADLNVLMRRYGVTGKMPESPRLPSYGDFTGISDFRSALHAVRDAEDGFLELPAEVRSRFGNDPQLLLEFVSEESNRAEAMALGLLKPVAPPAAPIKVEVTNPVVPPTAKP